MDTWLLIACGTAFYAIILQLNILWFTVRNWPTTSQLATCILLVDVAVIVSFGAKLPHPCINSTWIALLIHGYMAVNSVRHGVLCNNFAIKHSVIYCQKLAHNFTTCYMYVASWCCCDCFFWCKNTCTLYEVCPRSSWTSFKTLQSGPIDLKLNHICKG